MTGKIPPEAFDYYMSGHTYEEVADEYGVSKRAVVAHAKKHEWQVRAAKLQDQARERTDRKIVETLEAMNDRHLKSLRFMQGKAIEALRSMPLGTAMEAVRTLDLAIKQERVIRGEPSDRTAVGTGVLVVPAPKTPEEWIAEQRAKNAERVNPLLEDEAG